MMGPVDILPLPVYYCMIIVSDRLRGFIEEPVGMNGYT